MEETMNAVPPQKDNIRNASVQFHERLARKWDEKYCRASFGSRIDVVHGLLAGRIQRGQQWLDAGCGTGTLSRRLVEWGGDVLAVDASPAMLHRARQLTSGNCGPISFESVESIERLPAKDRVFDGILCSSVIEYVDDPIACLREFFRVLKPGGLLVLSAPNARSVIRRVQKVCFWLSALVLSEPIPRYLAISRHAFRGEELAQLVDHLGFRTIESAFCGPLARGALARCTWLGSITFLLACKPVEGDTSPR